VAIAGIFIAFEADTPSGGTIVLLAVAVYGFTAVLSRK
jgi:ABC-type Mn2+/Zn2+ transport system permease subunit